ncbi:hypothetical protein B9Z55_027025 [Caenorhabditis nigoni]|uniref:F-box domain-containing protein n=1 Tax=Caenorhabditis nigoni TaxID=1611254 RepID=A0A2G5SIH7_9PELO|nr:hypothetical protein B9Z55_027025 [Caenorhabditis nigoni]
MELSSNFIKKNQHFLKSCILYEVLQKKPIFDSYRNFCETVGTNVMEYPDFEFWYYRFYQRELDFDYDRSVDPEPKTLVDMPVVLMKTITQNLDSVERARVRYMNHAIKAVADSFPPVVEKIDIVVTAWSMYGTLNNKRFEFFRKGSGYERNSSEAEESDKCYMEKGTEHLALMLKTPKIQANHVSLQILEETLNLNDFLPIPFNTKSIFVNGRTTNQVVQSLSAMNPGHLESIRLDGGFFRETEYWRMVFETDQIKQAKSVELPPMGMKAEDLLIFSHLKSFKCHLRSENTFEDVPRIRDILSTFKELESCEFGYYGVLDGSSIRVFAMALGEEIPIEPLFEDGRMIITHRYQIPETNERLEFKLKDDGCLCRVNIIKTR